MTAPHDIARCSGTVYDSADLCRTCVRMDPPRHAWQTYIAPAMDAGACPNRIPRDDSFAAMGEADRAEMIERGYGG